MIYGQTITSIVTIVQTNKITKSILWKSRMTYWNNLHLQRVHYGNVE